MSRAHGAGPEAAAFARALGLTPERVARMVIHIDAALPVEVEAWITPDPGTVGEWTETLRRYAVHVEELPDLFAAPGDWRGRLDDEFAGLLTYVHADRIEAAVGEFDDLDVAFMRAAERFELAIEAIRRRHFPTELEADAAAVDLAHAMRRSMFWHGGVPFGGWVDETTRSAATLEWARRENGAG